MWRNRIRCKLCKDVIESLTEHDFKRCKCGAVAVDGGQDYRKRLGDVRHIEELPGFTMSHKWRGRTWGYVLHRYFPGGSEDIKDAILWNLTCYPFSPRALKDLEKVRRKVKPWNKGWTNRVWKLMADSQREMDRLMDEARKER